MEEMVEQRKHNNVLRWLFYGMWLAFMHCRGYCFWKLFNVAEKT